MSQTKTESRLICIGGQRENYAEAIPELLKVTIVKEGINNFLTMRMCGRRVPCGSVRES